MIKTFVSYTIKKNGWQHKPINRANVMAYNADGKKYKEIVIKNF